MKWGVSTTQKINKVAVALIKSFEGFSATPYKAHVSEKYYTIGYGHYGKDVTNNMCITEKDATKLLESDLVVYANMVNKWDKVYKWTLNEFNALLSFCYNIGNIDQLTANGKRSREEIANKMLEYCHRGTWVLKGLQNRRKKESNLFRKGTVEKLVIATSGLNVREKPNTESKKLTALPRNTIVKVISSKDGWALIDCSNRGKHYVGYVSTKYLGSDVYGIL